MDACNGSAEEDRTNVEILATAGAEYKAVVEQFTVAADSTGKITIQFATVKDNAQVNGIEILSRGKDDELAHQTGQAAIKGPVEPLGGGRSPARPPSPSGLHGLELIHMKCGGRGDELLPDNCRAELSAAFYLSRRRNGGGWTIVSIDRI